VTVVAVMSTLTIEGGRVFASDDAAATVTAARSVADDGIDVDDPAGAAARADDAASSSMLEKGKPNKMERRILVFRRSTQYNNSVWAVD
jgi:hypothetical protein